MCPCEIVKDSFESLSDTRGDSDLRTDQFVSLHDEPKPQPRGRPEEQVQAQRPPEEAAMLGPTHPFSVAQVKGHADREHGERNQIDSVGRQTDDSQASARNPNGGEDQRKNSSDIRQQRGHHGGGPGPQGLNSLIHVPFLL